MTDHQPGVVAIAHHQHLGRRADTVCHWLLAEHGLIGTKRTDRPRGVVGVRGGDVHGVDVGIVQQRGVGAVGDGHVVGVCKSIGGILLAAAHRL